MVSRYIKSTAYSAAWVILVLSLAIHQVRAEERLALVIGNSAYSSSPLANPVNDAQDLASTLADLGFEVIYKENVRHQQMEEAVSAFAGRLKQDTVGLFYYAGHGVQVKGSNYLLPIDNGIQSEAEVKYKAMNSGYVLDAMESAENRLNIVIVDACRNNPFAGRFRSLSRGLARVKGPIGSIIGYATAPGDVAADGEGRNGVYTKHLLEAIRTPGLDIESVFKQVRNQVMSETANRQVPWEESSLREDFYFTPPRAAGSQVASAARPEQTGNQVQKKLPVQTPTKEQRVWQGIRDSNDPNDFSQFLRSFPDGDFADYARRRLVSLGTLPALTGGTSAPRSTGPPIVAVADVQLDHPSARLVFSPDSVRSMVTQELYDQGTFKIIDDERFDDLLFENDLEWSDLVESAETRENIQQALLNDYFLVVTITSYSENIVYNSSAFTKSRSQITSIKLTLQLLDALTNEVVQSAKGKAKLKQETTKSVVGLGPSKGVNQELANEVLEAAVIEALTNLKNRT